MLSRRTFLQRLGIGALALPVAVLLPETASVIPSVSVIDYDAPLIEADYERIGALVQQYGEVPTFDATLLSDDEFVALVHETLTAQANLIALM